MIENQKPQEKLLTMLTEIYDQLEELEAVLENSLTDLRGNLYQQHSASMTLSEEKLNCIEQAYNDEFFVNQIKSDNYQNRKQALKLELGF